MQGQYFHNECLGCISYGTECERGCEYSDSPEQCKHFIPLIEETGEEYAPLPGTPEYEEEERRF